MSVRRVHLLDVNLVLKFATKATPAAPAIHPGMTVFSESTKEFLLGL